MRILSALLAASATAMAACASPQAGPVEKPATGMETALAGDYGVSPAALATAVRGPDGRPVGLSAYERPIDAIEAGDLAAFIAMARLKELGETANQGVDQLVLAVDRIAARDFEAAREDLEAARGTGDFDPIVDYIDAWIYALEGDGEAAVRAHRAADGGLPGLSAELSLAAMLDGLGRTEEALAVYASMTPSKIEAPEHQFDPQAILFSHVQMVVARRALLLRRLGRIEEAQDVYRRMAEAEPERAVFYAAALESLETGRGLDDKPLDVQAAFARSLSDLSMSLYQQKLIRGAMVGLRFRGLDETRAVMEMLALLSDPDNEDLRGNVISLLYEEAHYQGAAHVAQTAPEPTAQLQVSAAQANLMGGNRDAARAAIARAITLAEPDRRISVLSGSVGLYALLGDEDAAVSRAKEARSLATNDAERASTAALTADVLQQFGRAGEGVAYAREARELDDTHQRRMALASLLGEAGQVEEGLQMIQRERLKRPNDPYMLNTLGYYLIEHTDRFDDGFRVLYSANALARNDAYIADSLGWAYYRLGHLDEALRLIEMSRNELAPKFHWEIEDHYGDILWHLERREDAKAAWTRALAEFPPHATEMKLRDKLESGLPGPPPEKRPVPRVSNDDPEVTQRKT